jgi:hypothetical protein
MLDTTEARRLLNTLAQQHTDKRHADDQDSTSDTTLPTASNPDIVAWLRSLAPLSEQDIYNSNWKD